MVQYNYSEWLVRAVSAAFLFWFRHRKDVRNFALSSFEGLRGDCRKYGYQSWAEYSAQLKMNGYSCTLFSYSPKLAVWQFSLIWLLNFEPSNSVNLIDPLSLWTFAQNRAHLSLSRGTLSLFLDPVVQRSVHPCLAENYIKAILCLLHTVFPILPYKHH